MENKINTYDVVKAFCNRVLQNAMTPVVISPGTGGMFDISPHGGRLNKICSGMNIASIDGSGFICNDIRTPGLVKIGQVDKAGRKVEFSNRDIMDICADIQGALQVNAGLTVAYRDTSTSYTLGTEYTETILGIVDANGINFTGGPVPTLHIECDIADVTTRAESVTSYVIQELSSVGTDRLQWDILAHLAKSGMLDITEITTSYMAFTPIPREFLGFAPGTKTATLTGVTGKMLTKMAVAIAGLLGTDLLYTDDSVNCRVYGDAAQELGGIVGAREDLAIVLTDGGVELRTTAVEETTISKADMVSCLTGLGIHNSLSEDILDYYHKSNGLTSARLFKIAGLCVANPTESLGWVLDTLDTKTEPRAIIPRGASIPTTPILGNSKRVTDIRDAFKKIILGNEGAVPVVDTPSSFTIGFSPDGAVSYTDEWLLGGTEECCDRERYSALETNRLTEHRKYAGVHELLISAGSAVAVPPSFQIPDGITEEASCKLLGGVVLEYIVNNYRNHNVKDLTQLTTLAVIEDVVSVGHTDIREVVEETLEIVEDVVINHLCGNTEARTTDIPFAGMLVWLSKLRKYI